MKLSGGSSPRVTISLKVWNPGITDTVYELRRWRIDTSVENGSESIYDLPLLLSPTDVAWLEAETDTNNTIVDCEMDIEEVRQVAT